MFETLKKPQVKKFLLIASIFTVVVEILLLFVAAFPFDFAAYTYQIKQFYDFGVSPLFYWNKGSLLLGVFFLQYSAYELVLYIFHLAKDQPALLFFFMKLPLLFAHLTIGYIIHKLIEYRDKDLAISGLFLWLINPLILWMVGIQAQYAVLSILLVFIALFFLIKNSPKWAFLFLGFSVGIYYYTLIYFPFLLLYYFDRKTKKVLLQFIGVFIIGIVINFLPYFFNSNLLNDLTTSLLHHTSPDAPIFQKEIFLPNFSLFTYPAIELTGIPPSNFSTSGLFKFFSYFTFLALIVVSIYTVGIWFLKFIKKKEYQYEHLMRDLLVSTCLLLLFIGKFQTHYLVFISPFILIYFFLYREKDLLFIYFILPIFAILSSVGKQNIGIYFLNTIHWGDFSLWLNFSPKTLALNGFVCLIFIISLVTICLIRKKQKTHSKRNALFPVLILVYIPVYFFIFVGTLLGISSFGHTAPWENKLASDGNVYRFQFQLAEDKDTSNLLQTTYIANLKNRDFIEKNLLKNETIKFFYLELSFPTRKLDPKVNLNECHPNTVYHSTLGNTTMQFPIECYHLGVINSLSIENNNQDTDESLNLSLNHKHRIEKYPFNKKIGIIVGAMSILITSLISISLYKKYYGLFK